MRFTRMKEALLHSTAKGKKQQDDVKAQIDKLKDEIDRETSPVKVQGMKARLKTLNEIWDGYNFSYKPDDSDMNIVSDKKV